jgi:hypothetical protein
LTITNKVTYRNIAKMLASALPVEGEDFGKKVETNLKAIKALASYQKNALKMAYIFSRKVPRQEREDLFQDLALACFKAKTRDEKLAYAIARCDWINWWKKFKIRQHYSLDTVIEDEDGNLQRIGELIVGELDFEYRLDGKVDAKRIWHKLPDNIKPIVRNRLLGKALTNTERSTLHRWIKRQGYQLLLN